MYILSLAVILCNIYPPLLRYGKTGAWGITVPLSWFIHFYILSLILSIYFKNILVIHSARRLYECCMMPSNGRMFIGHYICGILFYCMANYEITTANMFLHFFGQVMQHETHRQLYEARKTGYKNIHEGWFSLFLCPHYTGEIVIYMSTGHCWYFVYVILYSSARQTNDWSKSIPNYRKKWLVFPFT